MRFCSGTSLFHDRLLIQDRFSRKQFSAQRSSASSDKHHPRSRPGNTAKGQRPEADTALFVRLEGDGRMFRSIRQQDRTRESVCLQTNLVLTYVELRGTMGRGRGSGGWRIRLADGEVHDVSGKFLRVASRRNQTEENCCRQICCA